MRFYGRLNYSPQRFRRSVFYPYSNLIFSVKTCRKVFGKAFGYQHISQSNGGTPLHELPSDIMVCLVG